MSHWAEKWAYEQAVEPCGAKFVLVALAHFADESGYCYPSQETLARMTGQSDRTVRAHLVMLEQRGLLSRGHRYRRDGTRTSDGYQMNAPADELKPRLPANSSGSEKSYRKVSSPLPENPAGRLPENSSGELSGKEPSEEPSEGSNAGASFLPAWLDPKAWARWVAHRAEIKHPVTLQQAQGQFRKLDEFRARGMPPGEVIEQSITNGWQGLFELKGKVNGNGQVAAERRSNYGKPEVTRDFSKYPARSRP